MKKFSGILNSLMAKLRSIHYHTTHMIMIKGGRISTVTEASYFPM